MLYGALGWGKVLKEAQTWKRFTSHWRRYRSAQRQQSGFQFCWTKAGLQLLESKRPPSRGQPGRWAWVSVGVCMGTGAPQGTWAAPELWFPWQEGRGKAITRLRLYCHRGTESWAGVGSTGCPGTHITDPWLTREMTGESLPPAVSSSALYREV